MTEAHIPSTRFFEARLSKDEAQVFDALCEQSGLTPNEVAGAVLGFVCRSLSGLREVKRGNVESFLTEEFGDLARLMARISTATSRAETAIEATRALAEMFAPVVARKAKN